MQGDVARHISGSLRRIFVGMPHTIGLAHLWLQGSFRLIAKSHKWVCFYEGLILGEPPPPPPIYIYIYMFFLLVSMHPRLLASQIHGFCQGMAQINSELIRGKTAGFGLCFHMSYPQKGRNKGYVLEWNRVQHPQELCYTSVPFEGIPSF